MPVERIDRGSTRSRTHSPGDSRSAPSTDLPHREGFINFISVVERVLDISSVQTFHIGLHNLADAVLVTRSDTKLNLKRMMMMIVMMTMMIVMIMIVLMMMMMIVMIMDDDDDDDDSNNEIVIAMMMIVMMIMKMMVGMIVMIMIVMIINYPHCHHYRHTL